MNWIAEYRKDRSFVTVVTNGDFTLEDHEKMIKDIVSREFWQPGTDVFFDHRKLNFGQTSIDLMKRASANHHENDELIGDGRAAILMKSLVDFGRGRQFELLPADKVSAKMRIFMDADAAINWLEEKA